MLMFIKFMVNIMLGDELLFSMILKEINIRFCCQEIWEGNVYQRREVGEGGVFYFEMNFLIGIKEVDFDLN